LGHPTNEDACGLLPTPTTVDAHPQRPLNENNENRSLTTGLKYGIRLVQLAENGLLPTPLASDHNASRPTENWEGSDLGSWVNQKNNGKLFQLNPRFVAQMMGYPENWTELPFQNGVKNQ